MTLGKHKIEGIGYFPFGARASSDFESAMKAVGYSIIGSGAAKGNRHKIWWSHPTYQRVESIYSEDKLTVITAYHV